MCRMKQLQIFVFVIVWVFIEISFVTISLTSTFSVFGEFFMHHGKANKVILFLLVSEIKQVVKVINFRYNQFIYLFNSPSTVMPLILEANDLQSFVFVFCTMSIIFEAYVGQVDDRTVLYSLISYFYSCFLCSIILQ